MWLEIQTYPSISRRTEMENLQETMLFWWLNLVVRCKGLKSFSDRIHVHYHGQSWIPCKAWMSFISCLGYYVYIYIYPHSWKEIEKKSLQLSTQASPVCSPTLWFPSPFDAAAALVQFLFLLRCLTHRGLLLRFFSHGDFSQLEPLVDSSEDK